MSAPYFLNSSVILVTNIDRAPAAKCLDAVFRPGNPALGLFRFNPFCRFAGQLPPERGTIFRIKAILAVKGHPYKHVFHAVMDISDEDDAGPWAPGEKKVSKIVFIGKSLDQKFLREGFEAIFE
eukprot:symbB.v1.2.021043.t1/scaffold1797.1/size100932/10